MQDSGQPEDSSQALLEERSFGATRSFTAGIAEGSENRGNSKIHRRHGQKMQDSGQPEDAWIRLNGTMHDSSNLRVYPIETPETSVSGVFVFRAVLHSEQI